MKPQILISLLFLLLATNNSYSQDWKQQYEQGKSFKEIKATMAKKFKGKAALRNSNNYSKAFKQYSRWEYYWQSQLDVSGNFVSPKQVLDSWEEVKKMEQSLPSNATANWSYLGPDVLPTATSMAYPGMGRINAISFQPNQTNIVWAGAAGGGLWKSSNGGTNWEVKGDNLPVLGISDIAISYTGDTLYIATGDADGQHCVSVGVLKSIDGGNSFVPTGFVHTETMSNTDNQLQIHHLWIHPYNPNLVVATTSTSIRRTTDGGATWTIVEDSPATDLKAQPGAGFPNILFAAVAGDELIKSTDAGQTWTDNNLTSLNDADKMEIAISPSNPNIMYISSDKGLGKKSIDGGNTWVNMTLPTSYKSQDGYNMVLIVAANNPDEIFLGGIKGWVSQDGGQSWTQQLNGDKESDADIGRYVHSDYHVVKHLPQTNLLYLGHDGGIHKGNFFDNDAIWTDLSAGLFITQFYGLAGFPSDATKIVAGSQDNDGVWYNGTNWKNISNNSDGTGGLIDYNNFNISYSKSQSGSVDRTDNAWQSDIEITVRVNGNKVPANFVWPMAMDPITSTTIYAGYVDIYKSTDKGDNWTNITNETNTNIAYSSIDVAPSNPNVIYAIRGNTEIKTSTNAGVTWTTLTNPVTGGVIKDIKVSLTDPQKVYIVYAGYIAGSKVYRSTNSGVSWTNISTGMPNIPVHCIAEKTTSGDLYIGTTLGVYMNSGGNTAWTSFNNNLPFVTVNELDIHEGTNMLRAATFGRGLWKTPLAVDCQTNLTITANPATGTFNAAQTITTSGTVEITGTADFKAGTSITLANGFHAKMGSTFSAQIASCTPTSLNEVEVAALEQITQANPVIPIIPDKSIAQLEVVPNPTQGLTTITFNLKETTPVSIHVYNSNGQLIENLANKNQLNAGHHQFLFNGTYQKAGMYYIILRTNKELLTKKMIIIGQ